LRRVEVLTPRDGTGRAAPGRRRGRAGPVSTLEA
jgi:hypothetical protein